MDHDDESSKDYSSSSDSDEVGIVGLAIGDFLPPPPSSNSTSSSHTCLMPKGGSKVRNHDSDDDASDSDEEYDAPSYDELATLFKQYTSIITKSNEKIDKLKLEKKKLVDKCNDHEARCNGLKLEPSNVASEHDSFET